MQTRTITVISGWTYRQEPLQLYQGEHTDKNHYSYITVNVQTSNLMFCTQSTSTVIQGVQVMQCKRTVIKPLHPMWAWSAWLTKAYRIKNNETLMIHEGIHDNTLLTIFLIVSNTHIHAHILSLSLTHTRPRTHRHTQTTTTTIHTHTVIGRFSEAGLHEWMPFVMFHARSCERSQLSLPGWFLSMYWFMLCTTMEI